MLDISIVLFDIESERAYPCSQARTFDTARIGKNKLARL
jgi:hypothetical protein